LRQEFGRARCVLWVDEIEKALAGGDGDNGVSRRVLGTFLTWLAERRSRIFVVATANDVTSVGALASHCESFSGAEIEQAIVAALYSAHAARQPVTAD
jgi:hypothetical protein